LRVHAQNGQKTGKIIQFFGAEIFGEIMCFSFDFENCSHYTVCMTLDKLNRKTPAKITGFCCEDKALETRLREIGFAEGDNIEALHFGLFNRNPISVRLNGAIIALRRSDASAITLELVERSANPIDIESARENRVA